MHGIQLAAFSRYGDKDGSLFQNFGLLIHNREGRVLCKEFFTVPDEPSFIVSGIGGKGYVTV